VYLQQQFTIYILLLCASCDLRNFNKNKQKIPKKYKTNEKYKKNNKNQQKNMNTMHFYVFSLSMGSNCTISLPGHWPLDIVFPPFQFLWVSCFFFCCYLFFVQSLFVLFGQTSADYDRDSSRGVADVPHTTPQNWTTLWLTAMATPVAAASSSGQLSPVACCTQMVSLSAQIFNSSIFPLYCIIAVFVGRGANKQPYHMFISADFSLNPALVDNYE